MTVKNWRTPLREKLIYITPDGREYGFHDGALKTLLSTSGWGMPPADIGTTRGPYQHGLTPLYVRLGTRIISIDIYNKACDREEYWEKRADLLNELRYNRTNLNAPVAGSLKYYRADGIIRQVDVMLRTGPELNPTIQGNPSAFRDTIEFSAYNPILYYPGQESEAIVGFDVEPTVQLTFPFTFDSQTITFGLSGSFISVAGQIVYLGTWLEYPTITIQGPATNPSITNITTGQKLELNPYIIAANEIVTFDLTYAHKTVTNNFGDSLLGYMSSDSNLGTFSLESDPSAPGGINSLEIEMGGSDATSQVTFFYFNRYIGM